MFAWFFEAPGSWKLELDPSGCQRVKGCTQKILGTSRPAESLRFFLGTSMWHPLFQNWTKNTWKFTRNRWSNSPSSPILEVFLLDFIMFKVPTFVAHDHQAPPKRCVFGMFFLPNFRSEGFVFAAPLSHISEDLGAPRRRGSNSMYIIPLFHPISEDIPWI